MIWLNRIIRHLGDVTKKKTSLMVMRSPEWHKIEKEVLDTNPGCSVCGLTESCQVHHIFPFHYCVSLGRPDLELDKRNLTVLCETSKSKKTDDHHLLVGHLDNFESFNSNVKQDELTYKGLTAEQIRSNPAWSASVLHRMKPLNEMTQDDKNQLFNLINQTFPKL